MSWKDKHEHTTTTTTTNTTLSIEDQLIAFDVYNPCKTFKKSDPGPPNFFLSLCSFTDSSPHFLNLLELAKQLSPIPFKVAVVSDGGTVLVFNISKAGVPDISLPDESESEFESESEGEGEGDS